MYRFEANVMGPRDRTTPATLEALLIDAPTEARRIYTPAACQGLQPNAMQVLAAVAAGDEPLVGEIARRLLLDPSTVSKALTVLRARGLIRDRPDPDDRRNRRHTLTPAGTSAVSRLLAHARGDRSTVR